MSNELIPAQAFDSQILNLISSLQPDNARLKMIKRITATLKNISIEGAISLLRHFKAHNCPIYFDNMKWLPEDLANEHFFPELQGRTANETPEFLFWAGPPAPGKLRYYKGNLHTLLKDRVLDAIVHRGLETISMEIGFDIDRF